MKANNHYNQALRLLNEADKSASPEDAIVTLLTAQVHATLALRVDR